MVKLLKMVAYESGWKARRQGSLLLFETSLGLLFDFLNHVIKKKKKTGLYKERKISYSQGVHNLMEGIKQ